MFVRAFVQRKSAIHPKFTRFPLRKAVKAKDTDDHPAATVIRSQDTKNTRTGAAIRVGFFSF